VPTTHRSFRIDIDLSAGPVDLACLEQAALDFARRAVVVLVVGERDQPLESPWSVQADAIERGPTAGRFSRPALPPGRQVVEAEAGGRGGGSYRQPPALRAVRP